MSANSAIEWTDATWNPVTGCTKVSPGCDHCYAETFAERFRGVAGHHFERGFDLTLRPERIDQPLRWRRPRRIFVNSMSDLFHKDVPDEFIARVLAVIALTPQHTYQLLTKRHGRMKAVLTDLCRCGSGHAPSIHLRSAMAWAVSKANPDRIPGVPDDAEQLVYTHAGWPLRNLWVGVSVEDQQRADLRIPALLDTPAAVRWISAEPLLGPVDLHSPADAHGARSRLNYWLPPGRPYFPPGEPGSLTSAPITNAPALDWVVVGGESGHGARPMHPDWARSLRDQCVSAGVPFLFKQWGEWAPESAYGRAHVVLDGTTGDGTYYAHRGRPGVVEMWRPGKKAAGRRLDGREWNGYPT